jgi:hypothetical protein
MEIQSRRRLHGLVMALGIVLMLGGLVRKKYGAFVIGLIVAAVNARQLRSMPKA